jgi:hypothetical protein
MIETAVGALNVPELEALVRLNLELGEHYAAVANDADAEPQLRRTATALAAWRRARARYFIEECAETERAEADHEHALPNEPRAHAGLQPPFKSASTS